MRRKSKGRGHAGQRPGGSVFANVVFALNRRDEIHTVGWFQRTQAPFVPALSGRRRRQRRRRRPPMSRRSPTCSRPGSAWSRVCSGGCSARTRSEPAHATRAYCAGTPLVIERLTDGPVPLLAASGDRSDSRWSAGLRAAPAQPPPGGVTHALQFGADIAGGDSRVGALRRLDWRARRRRARADVDVREPRGRTRSAMKRPFPRICPTTSRWARAWWPRRASATTASGDRPRTPPRASAGTHCSANASFWWAATKSSKTWIFAGYRRAADSLPLDMLAYGDPAAPAGTVSAWTSQGVGPIVARVGPGTGGNPAFSAIDASLNRPTTDEFTVGAETRPMPGMRVRLAGVMKRQQNRIDLGEHGRAPFELYAYRRLWTAGRRLTEATCCCRSTTACRRALAAISIC